MNTTSSFIVIIESHYMHIFFLLIIPKRIYSEQVLHVRHQEQAINTRIYKKKLRAIKQNQHSQMYNQKELNRTGCVNPVYPHCIRLIPPLLGIRVNIQSLKAWLMFEFILNTLLYNITYRRHFTFISYVIEDAFKDYW